MGHQASLVSDILFTANRRPGVAVELPRNWVQSMNGCCCPRGFCSWLDHHRIPPQSADMASLYAVWQWDLESRSISGGVSVNALWAQHSSWPGLCYLKENTRLPSKRVGRNHNTGGHKSPSYGLKPFSPLQNVASTSSHGYTSWTQWVNLVSPAMDRQILYVSYCDAVRTGPHDLYGILPVFKSESNHEKKTQINPDSGTYIKKTGLDSSKLIYWKTKKVRELF